MTLETSFTKQLTQKLNAAGYYGVVTTSGVVVNPHTFQPEYSFFFRFPQGRTFRTPITCYLEPLQDNQECQDELVGFLVAEFKDFLQRVIDRADKPVVIKL